MNDAKGLLAAICDDPSDDTPRLVYADWLDDNGDPERAEFIRGQIELLKLAEEDPRLPALAARTEELEKKHHKRWRRGLPKWTRMDYEFAVAELMRRPDHHPASLFHRGFPTVIECDVLDWRDSADKLVKMAPIQGVNFEGEIEPDMLKDLPHLDRLIALDMGETDIAPAALGALFSRYDWSNLRLLHLHLNALTASGVAKIAKAKTLASLTALDLWGNDFGAKGMRELAKSPHLRSLELLSVSHNELGDAGARALAESPILRTIRDLDLGGNDLSGEGLAALARSKNLGPLTHLHLGFNQSIDEAGTAALAEYAQLAQLVHLDLQENPLGVDGIRRLLAASLPRLRTLDIANCDLDASACEAIAVRATLPELRSLDISNNALGNLGVSALARSASLRKLHTLNLGFTGVGDEGSTALARSAILKRVDYLQLYGNSIGDAGAGLLAEQLGTTAIRSLHLGNNRIGTKGGLALASAPWLDQLQHLQLWENPLGSSAKRALKQRLGKRVSL